MKKLIVGISLLLLGGFMGCSDSPSNSANSITQEVKQALPVEDIFIYGLYENSSALHYGTEERPFDNAFAENGFLVIVFESGQQQHYNLSKAKRIDINPQDDISLRY